MRREQNIQMRMVHAGASTSATEEAEELINRVLGQDDPFEQSEILGQINRDLNNTGLTDTLADAGFGAPTRATAEQVLDRLKSKK